jgi:hypothetical protein
MAATVLIKDDSFELLDGEASIGGRRPLDADALKRLNGLAARYALLEQRPDPAATHAIGRDLYRWIDGDERTLGRLIERAERPLLLTIHCPSRNPGPVEWALLQAPWELLADDQSYLATNPPLQFSPQRRLGPILEPAPLDDCRLGLAFMAAAPQGVSELEYEAE